MNTKKLWRKINAARMKWWTFKRECRFFIQSCKPYWKHILSKGKLRGKYVTWLMYREYGWIRINGTIFRWSGIKIENLKIIK